MDIPVEMDDAYFERYAKETPCVGCSYCCRQTPCSLAMRIYPNITTKCPALAYHDGRWWCEIVDHARGSLKDEYIRTLSIGAGCCSPLGNTDRKNIPTPESLEPAKRPDIDYRKAFQSLCHILGTEFISGDQLFLIALRLKKECSEEEAKEFLHWLKEGRGRFVKGFMG